MLKTRVRKVRIGNARSPNKLANTRPNSYFRKSNKKQKSAFTIPPKVFPIIILLSITLFLFVTINGGFTWQNKQLQSSNPEQLNIAIVILLTKDPGMTGGFLDSITSLSLSINAANSSHKITKVALIHSEVTECIHILKHFNYTIVSAELPLTFEDIKNQKYANELKDDGCCGILELLKLEVWTMKEYDYVLAMDADMLFHKNFDALFVGMSLNNLANANKIFTADTAEDDDDHKYNGKYLGWTHGATADIGQELMNGGFLVVRPNLRHYVEMLKLIIEGDFRDGTAWKGSGIGWVYGGRTIQGIVPYYYFGALDKKEDIEFDRCVYNNMVEIEKCRKYKYEQVINNHFTWCQKPWYCRYQNKQPLCIEFNEAWWESSRKVETLLKLEPREECPNGKYVPIDYQKSTVFSVA